MSPFLAALFVLAQIFALSWKQRDPPYTIFLHLFLSHATISQSGSSILHSASESLTAVFEFEAFLRLMLWAGANRYFSIQQLLGNAVVIKPYNVAHPTKTMTVDVLCASMLIVFAFSKTSVSGVWVIQWIPRIDLRHRWWKRSSCFRCLRYTTHVSHEYRRHVNTQALYTSSLVLFFSPLCDHTRCFRAEKAPVAFFQA